MSTRVAPDLESRLRAFLAEDLGTGDVTTEALVEPGRATSAELRAKERGVVAGLRFVEPLVRLLDPAARFRVEPDRGDGATVEAGAIVGVASGEARALLAAERTLLNLVQRSSGIATLTARFVAAVSGTGASILDTRKTAPGLRLFDRAAVVAGGGVNHRSGLWDQVLLKSNHLVAGGWLADENPSRGRAREARRIVEAVRAARARAPADVKLEIEVLDADEAVRAADAGADLVLLDNFTPRAVRDAVSAVRARHPPTRVLLEASGSITLENVREYAEAGVERLSIGALTHSARALDLSLRFTAGSPEAKVPS